MRDFLRALKLDIKGNWQIFKTRERGLDFLGYRLFGTYTLLRKKMATKIKRSMHKAIRSLSDISRVMSYIGWLKTANAYNFLRILITKTIRERVRRVVKRLHIKNPLRNFGIMRKCPTMHRQLTLF